MGWIKQAWPGWLWSAALLLGATFLGLVVHFVIFSLGRKLAQRTASSFGDSFVRHSSRPARMIFPLLVLFLVMPVLQLPRNLVDSLRHLIALGLIAAGAWLIIAFMDVTEDFISLKYKTDVQDNLHARRIRTQALVFKRIVTVVVGLAAFAIMLMTFPSIRQVGTSILASAGLAGLVVGLAARPALTNIVAGVQIALAEPIRLDDVVFVEGEWGRIEEIGSTYVVVRIWDLRRLVVPLSYFVEKPFQNWTRKTANLLGTVFVYADYAVSVEAVRQELHRILQISEIWDRKAWALEVTNASEHSLELRALMSAEDSPKLWDLRCQVREKLVAFLQQHYPQSLPKTRAEIQEPRPH
ncbi:MAG: mechanosensitive ion channel protein MscS [Acidobacteria bacterium]|nr:MAG: mechanosensitive ion channel protein MscS [Acidobacteriota bacterium]